MINFVVFNMKSVIKFFIKFFIFALVTIMTLKIIAISYNFCKNLNLSEFANNHLEFINDNISVAENFNNQVTDDSEFKKILVAELSVFAGAEEKNIENASNDKKESSQLENNETPKNAIENDNEERNFIDTNVQANQLDMKVVQTSVIASHNKKDVYTDFYNTVQIKNESNYSLTESMVTPDIKYSNNKDILIYHTHTCESYTPTENSKYIETGNYRTTDYNYSVVRVGEELTNNLAGKGYTVIHDKTYHDYPAYTGSYNRSLSTITNLLETYKTVDVVFDIHRDALGSNSDYAPCVKIGEEVVAQLMFVIGTDGGGLTHPNWNNNLKLAIKVQQKANEMYPGLFKPIILRNSRYNQHIRNGAAIIEVGATGNTLEQCNGSMKYLADVLDCIMKECN